MLILIGMSGSGKTTAGKALASLCQCSFVDSDEVIEQKLAKKTIEQIFEDEGEARFRQFEKKALEYIANLAINEQKLVVATGGGLPHFENNFAKLTELGTIVFLKCDTEILAKRLIEQFQTEKKERPVLSLASGMTCQNSLIKKLAELSQIRALVYQKAHHCIDTSSLTAQEVVMRLKAFM